MIPDMRMHAKCDDVVTICLALHGRLMATLLRLTESRSGFGYAPIRQELKRCKAGCHSRTDLKRLWETTVSIRDGGYNPPVGDEITVRKHPMEDRYIPMEGMHRVALLWCLNRPIPARIGD